MKPIRREYSTWPQARAVLNRLKLKKHMKFVKSIHYFEEDGKHVLEIELLTSKDL